MIDQNHPQVRLIVAQVESRIQKLTAQLIAVNSEETRGAIKELQRLVKKLTQEEETHV